MEYLLVLEVGALCLACFFFGAKVGQKASRGEEITLPKIDLAKAREEREEKKKEDQERARLETILSNIDSYDGTSVGQKDIPR